MGKFLYLHFGAASVWCLMRWSFGKAVKIAFMIAFVIRGKWVRQTGASSVSRREVVILPRFCKPEGSGLLIMKWLWGGSQFSY